MHGDSASNPGGDHIPPGEACPATCCKRGLMRRPLAAASASAVAASSVASTRAPAAAAWAAVRLKGHILATVLARNPPMIDDRRPPLPIFAACNRIQFSCKFAQPVICHAPERAGPEPCLIWLGLLRMAWLCPHEVANPSMSHERA